MKTVREADLASEPMPSRGISEPSVDVEHAAGVRHPLRWISSAVVLLLTAKLVHIVFTNPRFEWDVVASWFTAESVMRGLAMTLLMTAIAMSIGIVLGTLVAVARLSSNVLLSTLAGAFVWLFRAIPELVQLLFWFNLAALMPELTLGIPFGPSFMSWETNGVITAMVAAILGLGLLETAYMAEVVRGGVLSVEHGQTEAAKALGMTDARILRRVVLPQAMRFMVPPTGSNVIRMVKATSLVSVIGMNDLLHSVQIVYSRTYQTIPLLTVACLWYLILNSLLFILQSHLERRFGRGEVRTRARRPLRLRPMNRNPGAVK